MAAKALSATMQSKSIDGDSGRVTVTVETQPVEINIVPAVVESLSMYLAQHTAVLSHRKERSDEGHFTGSIGYTIIVSKRQILNQDYSFMPSSKRKKITCTSMHLHS